MSKVDIEKVRRICEQEILKAKAKLAESTTPFYQQYAIGCKHAAQDILREINLLEVEG
jgi:hypothetical protein